MERIVLRILGVFTFVAAGILGFIFWVTAMHRWLGAVGVLLSFVLAPGALVFPFVFWWVEGAFPIEYFAFWALGVIGLASASVPLGSTDTERPEGRTPWVAWYLRPRAAMVLTLPLALLLVVATLNASALAAIQGYALVRASWAVYGVLGVLAVLVVGWAPVLLPPLFYFAASKSIPPLWFRGRAVGATIAVLVAVPLLAYLTSECVGIAIGWVADQDPCAALAAGISGRIPPAGCP
jgi:hypothetical protein